MLLAEQRERLVRGRGGRAPGGRPPRARRGTAPGRSCSSSTTRIAAGGHLEVRLSREDPLGRAAHRDAREVLADGDLEGAAGEADLDRPSRRERRRAATAATAAAHAPVPHASVSPAPRSQTTRSMPRRAGPREPDVHAARRRPAR